MDTWYDNSHNDRESVMNFFLVLAGLDTAPFNQLLLL